MSDTAPNHEAWAKPAPPDPPRSFSRRRLLIGTGAMGAAGVVAGAVATRPWQSLGAAAPQSAVRTGKGKLILVTLYGGNDGLNTVVPYTDSAYHAARPTLGYQPTEVLPLGSGLGLNPKLSGMKALWDSKQLAVVRGVGYPNPSLSHFQSMDIWQTASLEASGSGWLGRWLDTSGSDPLRAISVGSTLPPALRGERSAATAITARTITLPGGPAFLSGYAQLAGSGPDRVGLGSLVGHTAHDLLSVKGALDHLKASPAGSGAGPQAPTGAGAAAKGETAKGAGRGGGGATFAEQLQVIGSLIKAGAPTQVYQVSLASFDTHVEEKANQERLLTELDQGITSFFTTLKGSPEASDVVLMTYSEFGRRVAENASGGTDHGTASPLFIAGPSVKGGQFYGEQPSLTDLDGGDLRFNVDFRSVYATMLARVVGVDPKAFLGANFATLAVI